MNVASVSIRALFFFVFFLGLVALAAAQTPDTASLQGQTIDQTGAAVAGVKVVLTNRQTGLQRTAQSDASGKFVISGIPVAGKYDIVATHTGFADATAPGIELAAGRTADVALHLSAAGGRTEVTVIGTAGEVRTDVPQ